MAISKLICPDSNEELAAALYAAGEPFYSLVDYEQGIKSASSDLVSKKLLEEYRPTDDHTCCIHLIAMGDNENYGFNRNGDAFPSEALEKSASTFVTHGHVYREHRNKDPKKSLGTVKWAGYDPKGMHRVELIIHLDKDKAEEEFGIAKKGGALNFSMSCRVPNDRCSICGNEAKSVGEYCPHLKNNMGQYDEGFKKYAFAYNDNPTFFDISVVKTPADRIARHLSYTFKKSASYNNGPLTPSAYLAMEAGVNLDNMLEIDEMHMLTNLAEAEEYVNSFNKAAAYSDPRAYLNTFVFPNALMEKFSSQDLDIARRMNPGHFFREMAKRACIMSFPAFCQYLTGNPDIEESPMFHSARHHLPKVFRVMRIKITKMIPVTSNFSAGGPHCDTTSCCGQDEIDKMLSDAEESFSTQDEPVKVRIIYRTTNSKSDDDNKEKSEKDEKKDDDDKDEKKQEKAANIAECYGQYQIRALCDIRNLHGSNAFSDSMYDLIASANKGISFA